MLKKQKGVVVVCMGRCCGPNDLENMHPAQQSSAATMRAVTAAVLADAASVLADAASALADAPLHLQIQHKSSCKHRSASAANTDLYLSPIM